MSGSNTAAPIVVTLPPIIYPTQPIELSLPEMVIYPNSPAPQPVTPSQASVRSFATILKQNLKEKDESGKSIGEA